jgi:hypothetical protein
MNCDFGFPDNFVHKNKHVVLERPLRVSRKLTNIRIAIYQAYKRAMNLSKYAMWCDLSKSNDADRALILHEILMRFPCVWININEETRHWTSSANHTQDDLDGLISVYPKICIPLKLEYIEQPL